MIGRATAAWVIQRWYRKYESAPAAALITSMSGMFAARSMIQPARGVRRFNPARLNITPTMECVKLSIDVRAVLLVKAWREQQCETSRNNTQAGRKPAGILAVNLHIYSRS